MSFTTTTPNMSLVLPTPTQELGPAWAVELNDALTQVDSHNHTAGQGVPVPSAALNINADLSFQGNNLTNINSSRYNDVGSPLSSPADIRSIYISGGNLYYNNQLGQQVQITAGASLNAASIGGIGGDYVTSGASVYYTAASLSYSFTSFGNLYANMFNGAVTIYETGTNVRGVTIQSPPSLAAAYNLTLPTALPAADNFMVLSASGQISSTIPVSLGINTANIANLAVITAKLADNAVTTIKITDANVTRPKLAAVGQQISSSSGTSTTTSGTFTTLTNMTVTITTTGRPVMVALQPDGTTNPACSTVGTGTVGNYRIMVNGVTLVGQWRQDAFPGAISRIPIAFTIMDLNNLGTPGTRTYTFQANNNGGAATGIEACKLVAYELA